MNGRGLVLLLLFPGLTAAACGRREARQTSTLPKGDAVWFSDSSTDPEIEGRLAAFGCAVVFLPVREIAFEGSQWVGRDRAAPARPFSRIPVALVLTADRRVADSVARTGEAAFADVLWREAQAALARQREFGAVSGIHLDLPFSASSWEAYAAVARRMRERLPAPLFFTVSLRRTPSEEERERVEGLARQVDGVVAFVLGEGNSASPVGTEALDRPWWAAYAPAARGVWKSAAGQVRGTVPEKFLDPLLSDPRTEFGHDLSLGEASTSNTLFSLRARDLLRIDGLALEPGDHVSYRQPALADMLFHLGADRTGRRLVRGRVFVFEGTSERERIFTVAALEDVLLGRALTPDLRVETAAEGGRTVRVGAENRSSHASLVSRVSNWVEVDLGLEYIADVEPGGFDRFEVFDREGRPVSLGRASRVRFYETLVGPLERIEPAAVLLRSAAPTECCPHRIHLVAAAGPELATDWTAPEP